LAAPLGDQRVVSLTDLTLLQSKLTTWKDKYRIQNKSPTESVALVAYDKKN